MKYKSKQTTIFSILALILIVLGVIFTLLFNNKLPMFHNLVVQSEKVDVTIVDGYPILSGKIKNISNEDVVLKENCLTINIWSDYWGEVYLQLHTDDKIILAKGQELDLSSSRIYVEYIFVYSVGELFTKDEKFNFRGDYYIYHIDAPGYNIYDKSFDRYATISSTIAAILVSIFAILALLPVIPYLRSKKRFTLAQSALAQVSDGMYLRGAFCQKKLGNVQASFFSKIKGSLKSLTSGVKILTRYQSAEIMDFIITAGGFYIASAKSKTVNITNMEFFDKEELGKTQIVSYGNNVVLNSLFNNNYFVFDLTYSKLKSAEVMEALSKMFDEDDEVQNVYFDENSAQKNL
ncbi:MAG: hypothetical protein K2G42_07010 [Clostridia bacterium]|nr:hypothetical protein [Clostridia bacterium]